MSQKLTQPGSTSTIKMLRKSLDRFETIHLKYKGKIDINHHMRKLMFRWISEEQLKDFNHD